MAIKNITDIYQTQKPQKIRRRANKLTLSQDEQLKILTKRSTEVLNSMVEQYVPERGRIEKPVSVSFDVPVTNNFTVISVEESAANRLENRDLIVGVRHKQRDRLISKFLLSQKSKKEIMDFLKTPGNQVIITADIKDLSRETDDYYNSL